MILRLFRGRRREPRAPLNQEQLRALTRRRLRLARELAGAIGFASLVAGVAAFDWRQGLIVAGLILQVLALFGALRAKGA